MPNQAHIVMTKHIKPGKHGDFGLTDTGLAMNDPKLYTFAGIACYHPSLFDQQPFGRYSVTPLLRQLADNQKLTGQLFDGNWIDIGSVQALKTAQNMAIKTLN